MKIYDFKGYKAKRDKELDRRDQEMFNEWMDSGMQQVLDQIKMPLLRIVKKEKEE